MSEKQFDRWWRDEGSGMTPLADHDMEEHAQRVSAIAWENGGYCADMRTRAAVQDMEAGVKELTEQILLRDEELSEYGVWEEVHYFTWRLPALVICAFVGLSFLMSRFL